MKVRYLMLLPLFAILITGAKQSGVYLMPESEEEARALVEGCTLADVIGDHNPKMIGIWGGRLTHQSWFLRAAVWNRDRFEEHLTYYWLAFCQLPIDLADLHAEGFLPIIGLDPVTGEAYRYGSPITGKEDFADVALETSVTDWAIKQQAPHLPKGEWRRCEQHVGCDEWPEDLAERTRQAYPNPTALRGAHLSWQLSWMLFDYATRRDMMPISNEDLLDGLWTVDEPWARDNPSLDWTKPGGFMFGIDECNEVAVAIWRDEQGTVYKEAYRFSPWPTQGWQKVPDFFEYIERSQARPFYERLDSFFDQVPPDYVPEIQLWICSLLN
jgi:hypothetical protein